MTERFGLLDFDQFHRVDLPQLLATRMLPVLPKVQPIAFRLSGDSSSYTYRASGTTLEVIPGDEQAHTIVDIDHQSWCDFIWELRTCFALLYGDSVSFPRGAFSDLARWEPILRAVLDGQAIYDLGSPQPVLDQNGKPVPLDQSFTLQDADDQIRDFLDRAGFVHLRSVFTAEEISALRQEIEAAIIKAQPDDRRSWWTTVDGKEVCNRVNYLNDSSELIAELSQDQRLRRIGRLAGSDLRDAADRLDGHSVVIKVPGATSGLADLPWHRDCGMGGHPVKCPTLNVGIQLDAASAASGRLEMIAGSHRGTSRLPSEPEARQLPVVALDTEPGDVTAHFGHVLHAAPPPVDSSNAGRRALYVTYVSPLAFQMVGPGQGYNDILFTRHQGRIHHVDELA